MNRRVSMLCLILVAAAGTLFATCAPADVVDLDVVSHGWWVATGWPSGDPLFEGHAEHEAETNALGITRLIVYLKGNCDTGEVWDGRAVYLTAGGDALFARFEGNLSSDGTTTTQEFVGGTGPFAGVRGTGTQVWDAEYDSPVHGWSDCESQGTLSLADLDSKMVPLKAREGELVSLEQQHVETEAYGLPPLPFLFGRSEHTDCVATQVGLYDTLDLALFNLDEMVFHDFLTKTTADGETLEGYCEGDIFPVAGHPDALGVDMQIWITGGTGRFENVNGKAIGYGLSWFDGRRDITVEGLISSVGSSKK